MFTSSYIKLIDSGIILDRIQQARLQLQSCELCPRRCAVNRLLEETGECATGSRAIVASWHPHFGEEAPLVGSGGSGTIFFSQCNLHCNFCQNYDISHQSRGMILSPDQLGQIMLDLQSAGCININLVTPSHVIPQILEAVNWAGKRNLRLPIVYNSSGYDGVESLQLLDGIIDIYMPDFKFWSDESAWQTCKCSDYREQAKLAIQEMQRQVGNLIINSDGKAEKGLLVRHLLMPGKMKDTAAILKFLAKEIASDTYVNIMGQYRPCGTVDNNGVFARSIHYSELEKARKIAHEIGLTRVDQ